MNQRDRFRGCLLGLAVGDAVGTTVEFCERGTFAPLTDMTGGGPFNLRPGQWTDDTSMALCLAASLVERGGFDADDQMQRYCRWHEDGYMSSTGRCSDIGNTVATALLRYRCEGVPFAGSRDPNSAGNGCIMRLAPISIHHFPRSRCRGALRRRAFAHHAPGHRSASMPAAYGTVVSARSHPRWGRTCRRPGSRGERTSRP